MTKLPVACRLKVVWSARKVYSRFPKPKYRQQGRYVCQKEEKTQRHSIVITVSYLTTQLEHQFSKQCTGYYIMSWIYELRFWSPEPVTVWFDSDLRISQRFYCLGEASPIVDSLEATLGLETICLPRGSSSAPILAAIAKSNSFCLSALSCRELSLQQLLTMIAGSQDCGRQRQAAQNAHAHLPLEKIEHSGSTHCRWSAGTWLPFSVVFNDSWMVAVCVSST